MSQNVLSDYFTEAQAAEQLNRRPRTLKAWRDRRVGPPVTYIGTTPYYRIDSLRDWLLSLEGKPVGSLGRQQNTNNYNASNSVREAS